MPEPRPDQRPLRYPVAALNPIPLSQIIDVPEFAEASLRKISSSGMLIECRVRRAVLLIGNARVGAASRQSSRGPLRRWRHYRGISKEVVDQQMAFLLFWGAFTGCGLTVLNVFGDRLYLLPAKWKDQTTYLIYLLSLCPRVCSPFLVVAISIVLIRHREWRSALILRAGLAACVISQLATVLIDAFVFP
jgi:hypothetical protein